MRPVDIAGRPFGRLRAVERVGSKRWGSQCFAQWRCHCDPVLGGCGGWHDTGYQTLIRGNCRSCGCLYAERYARSPVKGTPYPSVAAAARALGLSEGGVRNRLARGLPLDAARLVPGSRVVLDPDGEPYPSIVEAARALETTPHMIKRYIAMSARTGWRFAEEADASRRTAA